MESKGKLNIFFQKKCNRLHFRRDSPGIFGSFVGYWPSALWRCVRHQYKLFPCNKSYAKAADPNALLFINEYNLESNPAKLDSLLAFVNELKSQGAQIDGIGTQMHITTLTSDTGIDRTFRKLGGQRSCAPLYEGSLTRPMNRMAPDCRSRRI
ncbi:MAG: endo-1,4-beta-xylanase [Sphingobacteriales bacterium]|nr:endo-1,4-beta-xylanase [Sphingobacteriales bacterium]